MELNLIKRGYGEYQVADPQGRVLFTKTTEPHFFKSDVITLHRGAGTAGPPIATFKGHKLTVGSAVLYQDDILYSTTSFGKSQTFRTDVGEYKFKGGGAVKELFPLPKPRPAAPLLLITPKHSLFSGSSVKAMYTLSREALQPGPSALLVNGTPTPLFEQAMIAYTVIHIRDARRQSSSAASAGASGGGSIGGGGGGCDGGGGGC